MTLFVDASALIAMIADEPERDEFTDRVLDEDALWSPISCWETVSGLYHSYRFSVVEARSIVEESAAALSLRLVSIGGDELGVALDAYLRYGKGRHPARLNMGDCFAYACARANDARLLYKGDDFFHTDLA